MISGNMELTEKGIELLNKGLINFEPAWICDQCFFTNKESNVVCRHCGKERF